MWDWKRGDLVVFIRAVDEQLRGSGLTDGESLRQMYRSLCKAVLTAAHKHIGLKAVGMTGEYWKTQEIATAERERDEFRERLENHSEENKAKDREVMNLTSERNAVTWEEEGDNSKIEERDVVNPAEPYYKSKRTNRSNHNRQYKNLVSQKQKADGSVRRYWDVSNHKHEKHERGMKKAHNSRLRS